MLNLEMQEARLVSDFSCHTAWYVSPARYHAPKHTLRNSSVYLLSCKVALASNCVTVSSFNASSAFWLLTCTKVHYIDT